MEMDGMWEGRVYFACVLRQDSINRMVLDEPYKIPLVGGYLQLDPKGDGSTSGVFSFMFSSDTGNDNLDVETLDAWFKKAKIALCMSGISVEKLAFTGGNIIRPDGSSRLLARWCIGWGYEKVDSKFEDKHVCKIKKNYNMIQKYSMQNENDQFVNNIYELLGSNIDNGRMDFVNKWIAFNLIYRVHHNGTESEKIQYFAEVFSSYSDAKKCYSKHAKNIEHLLNKMPKPPNLKNLNQNRDSGNNIFCHQWKNAFDTIYHMRNCIFHESKFKLDCTRMASDILADVIKISLIEMINRGIPPKKNSDNKWDCSDVLA